MTLFMKSFCSALLAVAMLGFALASFAPGQELPSAPSATLQQQKPAPPPPAAPSPPPAAAPAQSATEKKSATGETQPPSASKEKPAAAPSEPTKNSAAANTADSKDDEQQVLETIRRRVEEVNVIFTVTDKHGRFVKNLNKDDFKVLDNNQPPKSIVNFRSETDLPLRVGLLVDASNSVRDRFKFEQESAIEFLNEIIRPRYDKAFVIGFDTTAEVTQDFTDDTGRLSHGVRMLRPGGGTALYDALYWACRDKLMKEGARETRAARRAIIILSDGEDNQSRVTREESIEMAQRAEVIVYTISTNVSGVISKGDKVLERISEATGGRAFFPFKSQDVANSFAVIQDELRSQYALAYKPAELKLDGRYHSIEIVAQNRKNLRVRARKGYYAPQQ